MADDQNLINVFGQGSGNTFAEFFQTRCHRRCKRAIVIGAEELCPKVGDGLK